MGSEGVVTTDRGSAMWTQEGWFHPFDPRPEEVHLATIARHLSRIPRFLGATGEPYSVAEHLCLCADWAREIGLDGRLRRLVLLHDAAEAYVGDMIRPIKRHFPYFAEVERKVLSAIHERFGLAPPTYNEQEVIDLIDNRVLVAEKRDLFPGSPDWGLTLAPAGVEPQGEPHDIAEQLFLEHAHELGVN